MEKITHRNVPVNGINMHVAEVGEGPAILFLHGFPELWYTWRHQMLFLSSRGYRAIAPDLRGYGDTDAPPSAASYTAFHVAGDLVGLLDALGLDRVFLVGHDWGAMIAWFFCRFRPDLIKALVNLSVAFQPRHPSLKPTDLLRAKFGEGYYMCRFQQEGVVEEEFSRIETKSLLKAFLASRDPSPPCLPKDKSIDSYFQVPTELPSWLSDEDIDYYASRFNRKGFTGGLNYYRNLDRNWELTAAWGGSKIQAPVKFIVGELDVTYNIPGIKEYIHNGGFARDVPNLQETVVIPGVAHFINQEIPDQINTHIYDFISKF